MDRPLKIVVGVALLLAFAAVIVGGYLVARRQARDVEPGAPDRVTGDVVTGLMAELRKAQAEATHWKAAAARLQRELDDRR